MSRVQTVFRPLEGEQLLNELRDLVLTAENAGLHWGAHVLRCAVTELEAAPDEDRVVELEEYVGELETQLASAERDLAKAEKTTSAIRKLVDGSWTVQDVKTDLV